MMNVLPLLMEQPLETCVLYETEVDVQPLPTWAWADAPRPQAKRVAARKWMVRLCMGTYYWDY